MQPLRFNPDYVGNWPCNWDLFVVTKTQAWLMGAAVLAVLIFQGITLWFLGKLSSLHNDCIQRICKLEGQLTIMAAKDTTGEDQTKRDES